MLNEKRSVLTNAAPVTFAYKSFCPPMHTLICTRAHCPLLKECAKGYLTEILGMQLPHSHFTNQGLAAPSVEGNDFPVGEPPTSAVPGVIGVRGLTELHYGHARY